jgi:cytochrome b pre-mRNA-processing protein 3
MTRHLGEVNPSARGAALPLPLSFPRLFRRDPAGDPVHALYLRVVERAREPVFYAELGVPDTVDGRFELVALHAFLVFHRLKADHSVTKEFAQGLFDLMFADFDRALREMGTGDLSVGKEVRRMAEAFYGRVAGYERGLAAGGAVLEEAFRRNLYGTGEASPAALARLAGYLPSALAALRAAPVQELLAGRADFGALP